MLNLGFVNGESGKPHKTDFKIINELTNYINLHLIAFLYM